MLPSVPRWNRYILDDHLKSGPTIHSTKYVWSSLVSPQAHSVTRQTRSGKNSSEFIFEDALHASEFTYTINPPPNHRFEVWFVSPGITPYKYRLKRAGCLGAFFVYHREIRTLQEVSIYNT